MRGYSVDMRERVIQHWQAGKTQSWIAETFAISITTVKRYIERFRKQGHVEMRVQSRMKPTIRDEQLPALIQQLHRQSDATLAGQVATWEATHGVRVGVSTMWRAIKRAGWTRKKRRWVPRNAI